MVLNACYSAPIAEALLPHVDCVVDMTGAIHDNAARNFAIGFYGGLGEHQSIAAAFEQGKAAVSLDGLSRSDNSKRLWSAWGCEVPSTTASSPGTPTTGPGGTGHDEPGTTAAVDK
ncbi:MAG: hypothetical protein E6J90_22810 [Deltaproteobacteria bacterium]|nr:MAG: hypothetical protein E6J91_35835 [Deltaproteobacteria bacterium]TMQ17061.1 MAG: hypothetical protein E6J90_22810 [Deltaproteobacteria bacterium]